MATARNATKTATRKTSRSNKRSARNKVAAVRKKSLWQRWLHGSN